jgi:hypothetical protein
LKRIREFFCQMRLGKEKEVKTGKRISDFFGIFFLT